MYLIKYYDENICPDSNVFYFHFLGKINELNHLKLESLKQ